jgi:glycosyltransferase involved in cell wall biosynthesis
MPKIASATRRINVAIVAPSLRILGGQAVQARRLLDRWAADVDVNAWLVPVNPVPRRPFERLLKIAYARTVATQLSYWPLLVRELRRADVVHVFSASYTSFLLSPLPAILVAKALGKPVVLNYRSGEAPDHLMRSAVARTALRHVDLNVVPSRFLQNVFASFDIPARVVANTIDLQQFAYRVRDPLRPRLLSTRNFEPLYNVACTLRACARVQAKFPDASLTLVGNGSGVQALRRLAEELRLRNVTFVGAVPPSEIAAYYAAADIYVQTPSIDNMPGSVLEAFASGLPVVATAVGGVPTILEHGRHGLLAPDNDDEAVANHVITLLGRPDYARQLAAAAHETCTGYEWSTVRDQWLAVYRSVIGVRRQEAARPVPIAIVLSSFDSGGTERQMTELIRRLDPRRFAVHVVCFRRRGAWLPAVEAAAASITEVPLTSFRHLSTARHLARFARWCREREIALVHACDIYANIFALPAAALARVPVRIGSRRGIANPSGTRGLMALQRAACTCAHRVVANSHAAAQCLVGEGAPAWKVRTIANGIDLDVFRPAPRRDRRRVITTVANLRSGKGHEVLLHAFRQVLEYEPDARLNLVGDGDLRPRLEQLARTLRISSAVAFLGEQRNVAGCLEQSDLFAFPSFMEASPNAVIEAMAAGLPIVATNVGGIPELIEDGRNGLLVPPGDPSAMATALLRLMEDDVRASDLAEAARRTVEARYSFKQMVTAFEALYLEELTRAGAADPVPVATTHAA